MKNLTKHFKRSEFACSCGFDVVDIELVQTLELVREHFNKPITITSACRCAEHNKKVGGKPKSQHLLGKAADFVVKDIAADDVQEYLETLNVGGLGKYKTFTHLDVREGHVRW